MNVLPRPTWPRTVDVVTANRNITTTFFFDVNLCTRAQNRADAFGLCSGELIFRRSEKL